MLCMLCVLSAQSCLTLRRYGLQPARLLCPCDTGIDCHFLFQGISPTQGLNPGPPVPPALQADSLPLSHWGFLYIAAAKLLQSCPTLCDPTDGSHQAPPSLGFSSKNTVVGCHFLLQCMKAKSESEVAQSSPTLSDPMDCNLPGSSIHGIFQAKYWSGVPLPSP